MVIQEVFKAPYVKECILCHKEFTGISKMCPACVERRTTQLTHEELIQREVERLTAEGYRCIPIGLIGFPKPDIITLKDNKVQAIEIQLTTSTTRKLKKYSNISVFDDVQFIAYKKTRGSPGSNEKNPHI